MEIDSAFIVANLTLYAIKIHFLYFISYRSTNDKKYDNNSLWDTELRATTIY